MVDEAQPMAPRAAVPMPMPVPSASGWYVAHYPLAGERELVRVHLCVVASETHVVEDEQSLLLDDARFHHVSWEGPFRRRDEASAAAERVRSASSQTNER